MLQVIRRYEVWVFLSLIVAVNFAFVTAIAYEVLPGQLYNFGRFILLAAVLFALVFVTRGVAGWVDVLRPMIVWRRSPLWYLAVLAIAPSIALSFLVLKGLATGQGLGLIAFDFGLVSRPSFLRTLAIGAFIGEVVWISYTLRQLSGRFGYYGAGVIVGAFWALWWWPMVMHDIGVIAGMPIWSLVPAQVSVAIVCALVYARTQSGLLVFVMQFMVNATILVVPVSPAAAGLETFNQFVVYYFLVATVLYAVFAPRRGAPERAATPQI